jgi:hypothetical protein
VVEAVVAVAAVRAVAVVVEVAGAVAMGADMVVTAAGMAGLGARQSLAADLRGFTGIYRDLKEARERAATQFAALFFFV